MPDLPVFAACSRLDDVVDDAFTRHEPVFLTRRGRRVAAVIDAEDLSVSPRRRRTWRTLRLPTTPVPRSPSAASSHVQDQVQPRTCRVHWSHADVELLAQN
ncbi:type II toxin-antitoxin system prevent-host-death family antitoxin, partial [Actinomyces oris]|uniref:type II toxin-antitoxin system prevent-host-death family antitoxin n=1 Tax=Actinomyces oris TaxID=544580 RepID=UPI0028D7681D